MREKTERLSMVFHPLLGDDTNLSVTSFSQGIEGLRKAVSKFKCRDLKIVQLSSNSPVHMTVEGSGQLSEFYGGLYEFQKTNKIPSSWPRSTIDAVREFLDPIGKSIGHLLIGCNDTNTLHVSPEFRLNFENSIQGDYSAFGTIDGMLDAVNIHGKKNTLTIYPVVGKAKITCEFDGEHLEKIKNYIGCYVEASGELSYRWRDRHPHSAVVTKIKVIVEDDLPTFSQLYGMAPNATHGLPSEEFVRGVRKEWSSH
ncbi:hypothetical protein [Emcibacter sp.]|uniref:hypothetical protein n=1 Tax=Emcibacter sp. TaxID=1979954 RepID=UPI002AA60F3D|nr:hypothetical protein [Emcibacter sp.]